MCPAFIWFTFIWHIQHEQLTGAPGSSNSTPLPTVCTFLFVNVNWIMQPFFFSVAYLLNVWVDFVVCCSFCAVTYQKKKMFFLCKETRCSFSPMCKPRVERLNIRKKKIYFLPCQRWYANFSFKKFFNCMRNGKNKHVSMFSSAESLNAF